MAAVINTNYLSLVAQNNLNKSQSALGTAIERLSSGLRINSAKDDAAGMAIANRFTANVRGLTQAARNANDGISLAQTTEGASSEVNTHLQRVRELAVQAGNGNYSQEQLDSMQDEINQRLSDINRISQQTDFNGVKVLSANAKPLTLQVGANDGETITLNLSEISVKTLGLNGFNVNGRGVVDNRAATINDISNPGNSLPVSGTAPTYDVTTKNTKATASDVLSKMSDGNTVTVTTGTTPTNTVYTFNAATGNFTFTNKSTAIANGAAGLTFAKDQGLIPANGTAQGTYTNKSGASVSFDVDSAGKLTIGGKAAYLQGSGADQVLTTNNTSSATQATAGDLFAAAGAAAAGDASITLGGKTYTSAGTTTVSFTDTVTKDVLLTKMATAVSGTATDKVQIQLGSGITKANVNIDNTGKITGGTAAIPDELYLDSKGTLTDVKSYNTRAIRSTN